MNADNNIDFDLEYEDVSKNPANPDIKKIEADVPAKYKEKSVEDLIQMHVNLEKVMHRQGTELGQLRSLTDRIIKDEVKPKETVKPKEPITSSALFEDPQKALESAIESSPIAERLTKLEQTANDAIKRAGQREFEDKYPTFREDVESPEFQEWVLKNKARTNLLVNLHSNYDFDSGEALWDMWKESRGADVGDNNAKAKVSPSPRSSTIKQGGSDQSRSKPVFSRAKLMELQSKAMAGDMAASAKWNDPEFQRIRFEAYAEKRVR